MNIHVTKDTHNEDEYSMKVYQFEYTQNGKKN